MKDNKIAVQMGEEEGFFLVDEVKDEITFETCVLDQIDYMPPSVTSYLRGVEAEGYLKTRQLYLDYNASQKKIFLRGKWIFSGMGADQFDALLISLEEISAEIKMDLYKSCCKDLIYVVAHKAYQTR